MIHKRNLALGRAIVALVALMFAVAGVASADPPASSGSAASKNVGAPAYTTKGPIEAKYQAQGPWTVTKTVSGTNCDRKQQVCDIWYPTDLGANPLTRARSGFKHPVVAWADGSGEMPSVYAYYLQHLASWGFIVVAARDDATGDGGTTVDAANYILGQAKVSSSVFYNHVDTSNVGAAGHSQGGASITSLHAHNNPIFKTYIGFHTAPAFFAALCCSVTPDTYAGSTVHAPIFQWSSKPDSGTPDWYNAVPDTAQKAFALLTYTNHGDIAGSPGCTDSGCAQGAYGYLGYSTAWLMWQLQGAADSGAVFKPGGEFFLPDPNWTQSLSNIR